jgi:hypothetical protein
LRKDAAVRLEFNRDTPVLGNEVNGKDPEGDEESIYFRVVGRELRRCGGAECDVIIRLKSSPLRKQRFKYLALSSLG